MLLLSSRKRFSTSFQMSRRHFLNGAFSKVVLMTSHPERVSKDIYLKLGVCVHYPKSNLYYQGRLIKMIFFSELCPFFFNLSSIKHPTVERWHCMRCSCFNLSVFQLDTLLWKKGVSCKISIFTIISFSFCQNFMRFYSYIVY